MPSLPSPKTKPDSRLDCFSSRPLSPLPTAASSLKEVAVYLRDWADLNWSPKTMMYNQIWDLADSIDPPPPEVSSTGTSTA